MKKIVMILMAVFFSGCATWQGVKEDTRDGAEWTKEKVHQGASYIKEKTQ